MRRRRLSRARYPVAAAGVGHAANRRIVAVGDLHGDLAKVPEDDIPARKVLRLQNLIDDRDNWIGGTDVLVQLGDLVDRGPYSYELMQLFHKLKVEAKQQGGHVEVLLGNHEVMYLQGDWAHLHKDDRLQSREVYYQALAEINDLLMRGDFTPKKVFSVGSFLASCSIVFRLDGLLFVHGGLSPAWAQRGIEGINQHFRQALLRNDENVFNSVYSPVWHRAHSAGKARSCANLRAALKKVDCTRMIVGHTNPDGTGIPSVKCGGRLILMDVWMSDWIYGDYQPNTNLAALEIYDGKLQPVYYVNEGATKVWV